MITNPALGTKGAQTGVVFLQNFVPAAITLALVIAVIIFVIILIIGAIQWITSGTDKQNLEAARGKMTSAIVGIVVLFSLYAVILFVEYFFCVNLLNLNIDALRVTNLGAPAGSTCRSLSSGGGPGPGGPGPGGPSTGQGLAACPCFHNLGCAKAGAVALGNQPGGTTCNLCTASGWVVVSGTCSGNSPITCYSTCN